MSSSVRRSEVCYFSARQSFSSCRSTGQMRTSAPTWFLLVEIYCRDSHNSSDSQPWHGPHRRTSSESSLILHFRDARKNSRTQILELHKNLGLTAPRITRRFLSPSQKIQPRKAGFYR